MAPAASGNISSVIRSWEFGIQKLAMCFKTIKTRVEGLHRKKWMICRNEGSFPFDSLRHKLVNFHWYWKHRVLAIAMLFFIFFSGENHLLERRGAQQININILSAEFNFYTDTGNISGLKNNTSSWQIYGKYPGRS